MTFKDFMTNILLVAAVPVVGVVAWKLCTVLGTGNSTIFKLNEKLDKLDPTIEKFKSVIDKTDVTMEEVKDSVETVSNALKDTADKGTDEILAALIRANRKVKSEEENGV